LVEANMSLFDRETLARAAPGLSVSAFGAAMMEWLMRPPVALAYGQICGHPPGQLHCPACYAAAGMVMLGLASTLVAARRPALTRRRG
jgi:hypothetical protein